METDTPSGWALILTQFTLTLHRGCFSEISEMGFPAFFPLNTMRFYRRFVTASLTPSARLLFAPLAIMVLFAPPASAQQGGPLRGVAIVIGNSDYDYLPKLTNPANDAHAIESLLGNLGFDVAVSSDHNAVKLKRDLERFAEDAQGAAVAVVYYSGHGIEAGGENFLIPVDADLASLNDATERLVPLSTLLDELRTRVPVVIVMLDACRNNPFPPGATMRLTSGSAPIAIAAGGLGGARGAAALSARDSSAGGADDDAGTVIAFSAAPGKVALDGQPGTDSPYAAAVLKHFSAMSGEEFGTVMRMVAEEVYLKTNGRQRPWVNESLTKLLYFGKTAPEPEGDEGDILKERRRLLLTIAGLPDFERKQVEVSAGAAGVPMDAVYGLLRTLGANVPKDPAELDKVLKAQSDRLKSILAERQTFETSDPEIRRLADLSDNAIREGALDAAIALNERAKVRVGELEKVIGTVEASLKARHIEFAKVYAKSAQAYAIAFEHLSAAQDYQRAFEEVRTWDHDLAINYRNDRVRSLIALGDFEGDNNALEQAAQDSQDMFRSEGGNLSASNAVAIRINTARAFYILGKRQSDPKHLGEAAETYRAILADFGRDLTQAQRTAIQVDLGTVLLALGERTSDLTDLQQAIAAFDVALKTYTRDRAPADWASIKTSQGNAFWLLGYRQQKSGPLLAAISNYRDALSETERTISPQSWATNQAALGNALMILGEVEGKPESLREALDAYGKALQEFPRDRTPLLWAAAQSNVGITLHYLGKIESDMTLVTQATSAFRLALEEQTRERAPFDWAGTQNHLAQALVTLATRDTSAAPLKDAVAAYRAALTELTREKIPEQWVITENNLANALGMLGQREEGVQSFAEAVSAYRQVLEVYTRGHSPSDWAAAQSNLGWALKLEGQRETGVENLEKAAATYGVLLEQYPREQAPVQWAQITDIIGEIQIDMAIRAGSATQFAQGISTIEAAWRAFQTGGQRQHDTYFADRLRVLQQKLAKLHDGP
ncbi:caspase family protein (plasmid) [Mesorhizobium sp. AR07]|uniref:caspase family protein n=1 Tax=Mesorhizobium sp. AR07 TaxID=2865838 RepID=UPI00215FD5A8|nr:caspase family protein [Mesorhizobium sp. AR07]UVK49510.1 caspase family protein [Mesorhizobium sp. AR07]